MKAFFLKYKRQLMIGGAVFLLLILFIAKKTNLFTNIVSYTSGNKSGLVYDNEKLGDLVNKDTDGDGVPDWEESLFGTDPTNKDTFGNGLGDAKEIEKIKAAKGYTADDSGASGGQNLSQTDKFARELFTTVTALNQVGNINQSTADQLAGSLSDQIKNTAPRKVYTVTDLKVASDSSTQSVQKYENDLNNLYTKYPIDGDVFGILKQATKDDGTLDSTALDKLTPIIKTTQSFLDGFMQMSVPSILSDTHLGAMNAFEKVLENLNDIQLADTDSLAALGAISQYNDNSTALNTALTNLADAISKNGGGN